MNLDNHILKVTERFLSQLIVEFNIKNQLETHETVNLYPVEHYYLKIKNYYSTTKLH